MTFAIVTGNSDASFDIEASASAVSPSFARLASVEEEEMTRTQIGGAAVLGGLTGLVFLGPISCLVLAGSAAAVATTKGKAGRVARSTGGTVANAGMTVYNQRDKVAEQASTGYAWLAKKFYSKGSSSSVQRLP
jgi:hypothetical protein